MSYEGDEPLWLRPPDLRFDLPIEDVSGIAANTDWVFTGPGREDGIVEAMRIPGGAAATKMLDGYDEYASPGGRRPLREYKGDHGGFGRAWQVPRPHRRRLVSAWASRPATSSSSPPTRSVATAMGHGDSRWRAVWT